MNGEEYIFRRVIAKTLQGAVQGEGVVIAYSAAPHVLIRRDDGTEFHWNADMCEYGPPNSPIPPRADAYTEARVRAIVREELEKISRAIVLRGAL